MASNALAEFATRAEPVDRIVFDEAAEFDRGLDVTEAIQFGIVILLSCRHEFGNGAGTKVAEVEECDACAVARATKLLRRAGTTDSKNRDRAEHGPIGPLEIRFVFAPHADHDSPNA